MFENLNNWKQPTTEDIRGVSVFILDIPHPPSLRQAIGCDLEAQYTGIWIDNEKVAVNNGYSNFVSSNPGWRFYLEYPIISSYIFELRSFAFNELDLFGQIENYGVAKHGFLLANQKIYLAEVKLITQILEFNDDHRPDWIKNATEQDLFDGTWQKRYKDHSALYGFPKYNKDCLAATAEMSAWLDNYFDNHQRKSFFWN